jgi:hypothetical protein
MRIKTPGSHRAIPLTGALIISLSAFGAMVVSRPASAERRRALLIAISKYGDPKAPDLKDAGDKQVDTEKMTEALKMRGFDCLPPLLEDQATHDNILKHLNALSSVSKPDDAIVVYFSGHGANSRNMFSLCPFDASVRSDDHDITAEDINKWLDGLKTRNVTIILDCCFSDVTSAVRARGGNPMKTKFIGHFRIPMDQLRRTLDIRPDRAVVLTGAVLGSEAYQLEAGKDLSSPLGRSNWEGLFTFYLAKGIKSMVPATTYSDLMEAVDKQVQEEIRLTKDPSKVQTPGVYGAPDLVQRPLFSQPQGAAAAVPVPEAPAPLPVPTPVRQYATVTKVENGKVFIDQGRDAKIPGDSTFVVHESDEKSAIVGKIQLKSTSANSSEAMIVDGSPDAFTKGQHAFLSKFNSTEPRSAKITVGLAGAGAFVKAMRANLQELDFLTIVDMAAADKAAQVKEAADSKAPESPEPAVDAVLEGAGTEGAWTVRVLASNGKSPLEPSYKFFSETAAGLVSEFRPLLERLSALLSLSRLQNPAQAYTIHVAADKPAYTVGDKAHITVQTSQDCYVILLDVDPSGAPSLLFPLKTDQLALVKANEPFRLPYPGTDFKIGTPTGKDTIMAVGITDLSQAQQVLGKLIAMELPAGVRARRVDAVTSVQDLQGTDVKIWALGQVQFFTYTSDEAKKVFK